MGRRDSEDRASSFDRAADAYDRFRPGYPPEALADLPRGPGVTIVEVGCGTGQATVDLARRAGRVIAVEPGPRMAAIAARRTAGLPGVEIEVAPFEETAVAAGCAHGVFAGTSWHWVPPEAGRRQVARILADGGVLVLAWQRPATEPVGHARVDAALAAAIDRLAPHLPDTWVTSEDAVARTVEPLRGHPDLDHVARREQEWPRRLDAATARGLFATFSSWARLEAGVRGELLTVLADAIAAEPGGSVETRMVTEVQTFRRRPRS